MVHKYPSTKNELRGRREEVPLSEIKFYEMLDSLNDEWHVWHSIRWDNDSKMHSGEADYLLFNPRLGFVVIEVKGGIISVEDGVYFTTNTKTGKKFKIKDDPFHQAERSMYHILNFYIKKAKGDPSSEELLKDNKFFPLNFAYAVYFPDCQFKQDFETLQHSFNKIFDESDMEAHKKWQENNSDATSPLEKFLTFLLNQYKGFRVRKPKIGDFFPKLIGSNISRFISLKKYYEVREQELEEVNQVQDFLLSVLSVKNRCIFRGSAGSGKTFIAMKKALRNYYEKQRTLFLCFNSELRNSVRGYLCSKIGKPYKKIQGLIDVFSIHSFILDLNKMMFDSDTQRKLAADLYNFSYKSFADKIQDNINKIPLSILYDAVLVDEAQDIDSNLWEIFTCLLKDQEHSLLYVFYDEQQALFLDNFSPKAFGMDEERDLMVLSRNLRNSVEIANWLSIKTNYGKYEEFSGIYGFKVSKKVFDNPSDAIKRAILIIQKKYYKEGVNPDQINILSYFKLDTLMSGVKHYEKCVLLKYKGMDSGTEFCIIEPKKIENMQEIKSELNLIDSQCILFKTITSFKGLEKDILFLIMPKLEDFKQKYPERIENFIMQLYVGASRAKFKLYFYEYAL